LRRRAKHNLKKGFLVAGKRRTVVKNPLGGRGSTLRALKDSDKSSICIIRSVGGIGDVLMITPALRELKLRYPKSKLTFAVDRHTTSGDNYYELVKNAPFIDHIIDARDVVHANYRHTTDISAVCIPYERVGLPPVNRIDLFANYLGMASLKDKRPFYRVEPSEKAQALDLVGDKTGKLIFISVGSMEGKRCWSQGLNDKWPELVSSLSQRIPGVRFIVNDFTGKAPILKTYKNVIYLEQTSIRKLAALISISDHFVGPDSGPMHMAGALGVPSTVVFGSIPPEARVNHYPNHTGVRLDSLPCIGCWYKACPYDVKCMRDLSASRITEAIWKKL
jgi:ADP-heptose:LPS heptosyltransferase